MINSLQPPIPPLVRAYRLCPPLAQACSLCLIQNSLYIPHTALLRTAPSLLERGNGGEDSAGASLQLVPNSKLKILSPSYLSHLSHSTTAYCPPLFWRGGTGVRIFSSPLARACSSCPIHNSKFIIPFALFRAHYRLKKLFSLW